MCLLSGVGIAPPSGDGAVLLFDLSLILKGALGLGIQASVYLDSRHAVRPVPRFMYLP